MKKHKRLIVLLTAMIFLLSAVMPQMAVSAAKKGIKRMNIVIVTDESYSMEDTDPDNMRYDAVKLFSQEITDTGNLLGSVSFAQDVLSYQELGETNGRQAKKQYVDQISGVNCSSWTNIGGALLKAVELLDKGDPNLESAIIILSDGNTEMPDDDSRKASLDNKADAVEMCRNKGIPVYSICLNVDGSADAEELRQISNATGGLSTEVKDPDDLKDVELLYSRVLFGEVEENPDDEEVEIGGDGTVSKEFEVPKVGVEELNIMIDGNVKNLSYVDPNGRQYSGTEVDDMTVFGTGYAMTKLIKPVPGKWVLTAYGDPNTKIRLRYMFNTNFYIETRISPSSNYALNEPITFETDICDGDGKVTDTAELQDIKAYVTIKSGDQEETIEMTLKGDQFEAVFTPDKEATYYAHITAEGPLMRAEADEVYEISVNNSAPIPPEETPKAHANIWPIIGGKATIDLNGTATDPEGEALTYTVDSTAFNEGDYSMSDNKLTVSHFSISKGSFTVRATDPRGAFCTFDVMFTSTNIGLIMAILTVLGILAALAIIVYGIYKIRGTAFMGDIYVTPYDQDSDAEYEARRQTPMRGTLALETFGLGSMGFAKGCYFQADGKNMRTIFKSKKPVYTSGYANGTKEVIIEKRSKVMISPQADMSKGIEVEFHSILDSGDGVGIII